MRKSFQGFVPASTLYDVEASERVEVDWPTTRVGTEGSPCRP
ncbi:hypothetical protein [Halovenus salina]|uniref:Uncharacterized protein n=1 Tax=Halovenus salina TaxID=1510225 RepID=A0ABD5W058_9EURY|nr:hypothetical protein [Halovenus salina]